jgi:hypothetical protein
MHTHIYYLSKAENTLVNLKAEGYSTHHILENCPIPSSGYHMFTADVKRKTGVFGRDYIEFHNFLEKYRATMSGDLTTPEQTRVMRQVVVGNTLLLNMSGDEIQSTLDIACKAAGIFTRDERARRYAMRLYLSLFRFNGRPLDDLELPILRGMAEGMSFEQIAEKIVSQRMSYLIIKAREACQRLYFDAQGRNAQRNLLRAYFAWIDAHKTDPMDDPMF